MNVCSSGLLERIQYLVSGNIQELTLLAPLGADVSAHAHVPSVSRVWVDVGLDVFLEFSLSEAVAFLTAKLDRLTSEVKASLERLSAVRARLEKLQTDGILFRQ
ncbi:unnamed protein product [Vitrella brassicaformis CCMP3155]|uniref:Uncharacterized protein n=1 Tax=Vitrella brassicaformis (strain CCMP3155) TaxID=1169540 RepID=A0A0G4EW91_VITBC|nr:unnamed protein product [Vitrella brassicaformis CCMP3155]|eukprot:CEM02307.1 unnamed protein product [Vitrella brassicaformis CCMP3155]